MHRHTAIPAISRVILLTSSTLERQEMLRLRLDRRVALLRLLRHLRLVLALLLLRLRSLILVGVLEA